MAGFDFVVGMIGCLCLIVACAPYPVTRGEFETFRDFCKNKMRFSEIF